MGGFSARRLARVDHGNHERSGTSYGEPQRGKEEKEVGFYTFLNLLRFILKGIHGQILEMGNSCLSTCDDVALVLNSVYTG